MVKIGIDISTYQKNINYDEACKHIEFAILRVGYGVQYLPDIQKDKLFDSNYENFKGKIPLGAYYYAYANEIGEGRKEAENCLKYIKGKEFELPVFYDIEDNSIQGLSTEDLTSIAREFVDTIKEAGYKPGIYASKYWLENEIDVSKFDDCTIWCASYGTNNGEAQEKAKYSGRHEIWQYTSRGFMQGINGYIDKNMLYGDVGVTISENNTPVKEEKTVFSGDDTIRAIQAWLNSNYNVWLAEDGYYGKETKKALVKALQHELNVQFSRGLVEDGIFGNKTMTACIIVKQGAKGNITYLIQAMLHCKGYDTNGIDGIFGRGTTSAVRRFQANIGITVDGVVGKNTFNALFK